MTWGNFLVIRGRAGQKAALRSHPAGPTRLYFTKGHQIQGPNFEKKEEGKWSPTVEDGGSKLGNCFAEVPASSSSRSSLPIPLKINGLLKVPQYHSNMVHVFYHNSCTVTKVILNKAAVEEKHMLISCTCEGFARFQLLACISN